MRLWLVTLLRLAWGGYLLLTSIYCLLAFLPYTYYALIKAPAYAWMPWFVQHQAALYWIFLLGVTLAGWPRKRSTAHFVLVGSQGALGLFITAHPFLSDLQSNSAAYFWSVAILAPLILVSAADLSGSVTRNEKEGDSNLPFSYSIVAIIATTVTLLYAAGTHGRNYFETRSWTFQLRDIELTGWSLLSHLLVAFLIVTILNAIAILARKTARPQLSRFLLLGVMTFGALWFAIVRFLENALSFQGALAHLYAGTLAASLTLLGFSDVLPFRSRLSVQASNPSTRRLLLFSIALALSAAALTVPSLIGRGDWNGILESTFTLLFWLGISACLYAMRPRRKAYSVATMLGVLILTAFTYKGLQASAIFWGKPLGETDDDIARSMETYATQDASFQLVHQLLGNARVEPCGDLCRILRQYTNIRDAQAKVDVKLVDPLLPTSVARPNIFIFVVDSLRPDYLGAYNPKVDFTPNLDSFARESVVVHNVFTQYAGTSLSEPAIWAGTMLLHAHFLQPFGKVNSLEKLARADGYQMIVSYDEILREILSPSDGAIKLDTDKPLWNRFDVCSTIQQAESTLDKRTDKSRPVLFYAQPKNVHQFASNDRPRMTSENWRIRPGFQNRIAYEVHDVDECIGRFIGDLKARGMYDNSIVILASDHGDATGQFGRNSHSTLIYPEIMRVPLIVHLPVSLQNKFIYDDRQVSTLTDITPSLYYLLGHRPIETNPLYGRPIFVETHAELVERHPRELFLASDVRAAYGVLADNGRYLYVTYDSPAASFLFDLAQDPNAEHNVLNDALKKQYDERIIEHLQGIADFYGYKPGVGSLLASAH